MTGLEQDQAQWEVEAAMLLLPATPSLRPQLHRPPLGALFLQLTESSGTASKHREVARAIPGKQPFKT